MSDTTKEAAARMRRELKAAGYNARKVSVRTDYYSMGSSISVTIRARGVDFSKVKEIAQGGEQIRRCEISGDILSGGNLFVHFDFSRKLRNEIEEEIRAEVDAGFAAMQADKGFEQTICGVRFVITENGDGDITDLRDDVYRRIYRTADALRSYLVRDVAENGTAPAPVAPVVLKLTK